MNILFIIKVKILVLIKWSCRFPTIMLTNESVKSIIFWAHSHNDIQAHVFLVSVLGATPYHTPLIYTCPLRISNWIRHIYLTMPEWEGKRNNTIGKATDVPSNCTKPTKWDGRLDTTSITYLHPTSTLLLQLFLNQETVPTNAVLNAIVQTLHMQDLKPLPWNIFDLNQRKLSLCYKTVFWGMQSSALKVIWSHT